MTSQNPIEELATWLQDKLYQVEVYFLEEPEITNGSRAIVLRPAGGEPPRGATRRVLVELRIFADSLEQVENLYASMEELLCASTRLSSIIAITSEGSGTYDVDEARRKHLRLNWSLILPRTPPQDDRSGAVEPLPDSQARLLS